MARFQGKVAIITGSSSGIGRATAALFAKDGAQVVITGRNAANLKATEDEILASGISVDNILSIIGDIVCADFQKKLIEETIDKFGRLDILVNNAGAALVDADGRQNFQSDVKLLDETLQLNLISVVQLVQFARPHLVASKGEVVNVSSIAALHFASQRPYYAIAKAALDQATRQLSIDLIKDGVRVNSVKSGSYWESQPSCLPVGHVGTSEEIAEAIAFLADRQKSSYIIGQTIVADGGTSLLMGMAAHDLSKVLQ